MNRVLLTRARPRRGSLPGRSIGVGCGVLLLLIANTDVFARDPLVLAAQQQRIETVARVANSVVAIFSPDGQGGGSGVLISPDGYALSNYHVTSEAGDFMKCGLNDGNLYDAVIVGLDPTGDVALLKLVGRVDFPHATLGDSDQVRVGDWVYAMGNPFLLATDFSPSVSYGIVSGVHRYQYPAGTILEYTDCIQVDASINPGNSGGPLFSETGDLIGINGRGSFEKRGRVNSGAGYAISINQIKLFLDQLKSGRIVDHATLGATVRSSSDRTVVIDQILTSSDAYRRGLREGDELVACAGRPIGSVNQFKNVLGIFPKGWTIPIVYRRDGLKQEVSVELRALHRQSELQPKKPDAPDKKPGVPPDDAPPQNDAPAAPEESKDEIVPPALRQLLVKKEGYVNYYFNKLEQERVLIGMAKYDRWQTVSGRWKVHGKTTRSEDFSLTFADNGVGLLVGETPYVQALGEESEAVDEPPGSGGLLTGLQQFRLLLTQGPKTFSDFYYLGSEPLDGRGDLVDVLISRKLGIETRWYFRRSDQNLVGFDSYLEMDVDPAEIRFSTYGTVSGYPFPVQLQSRCGERQLETYSVESIEMAPGGKP